MRELEKQFLDFALETGVLAFGEFTLKSGRSSPYFFNSGLFSRGASLARLGSFYARAMVAAGIDFDVLFGAAYKGIPLVAATAISLAREHDRDVGWSFNRKEAKDHGEHGVVVGAPLAGKVLIVDDVISAGTSVRESLALIRSHGASPVGLVVALDRGERGAAELSAMREMRETEGLETVALASLGSLMSYLSERDGMQEALARMRAYLGEYGAG